MTKALSGKELDQAAIDAAIARSPFNEHEKSHMAVRRSVMALMYKDGYRAALTHADYRALEEENRSLKSDYFDLLVEITTIRAPLEKFMKQWESDIQFYNGLDGHDLATWADLFKSALSGDDDGED